MNVDELEELKSAVSMASAKITRHFNLTKRCVEKDPSDSNKEYFRIDNNNLNTIQSIEELILELEPYPED